MFSPGKIKMLYYQILVINTESTYLTPDCKKKTKKQKKTIFLSLRIIESVVVGQLFLK